MHSSRQAWTGCACGSGRVSGGDNGSSRETERTSRVTVKGERAHVYTVVGARGEKENEGWIIGLDCHMVDAWTRVGVSAGARAGGGAYAHNRGAIGPHR